MGCLGDLKGTFATNFKLDSFLTKMCYERVLAVLGYPSNMVSGEKVSDTITYLLNVSKDVFRLRRTKSKVYV
jgi:hypothetical protein